MHYKLRSISALCLFTTSIFATPFQWSYNNTEQWGKHFTNCQPGGEQSPININTNAITKKTGTQLSAFLVGQPSSITNTGNTIQVNYSTNSRDYFTIGNNRYRLQKIRFHAPSENTINGKHFPLEAYFITTNLATHKTVYLSVMYQASNFGNPTLKVLWKHLPTRKGQSISMADWPIRTQALLPRNLTFYQFNGSLTQPPCSRNIDWYIFTRPQTISHENLEKFKKLYNNNHRPTQALNNRDISQST